MPPTNKPTVSHFGDRAFKALTLLMALSVFVLMILIGYELAHGASASMHLFGWHFLVSSDWDPVNEKFGALPFIFGTLASSAIGLCIAVLFEHRQWPCISRNWRRSGSANP